MHLPQLSQEEILPSQKALRPLIRLSCHRRSEAALSRGQPRSCPSPRQHGSFFLLPSRVVPMAPLPLSREPGPQPLPLPRGEISTRQVGKMKPNIVSSCAIRCPNLQGFGKPTGQCFSNEIKKEKKKLSAESSHFCKSKEIY